jgi:hypothetical protein
MIAASFGSRLIMDFRDLVNQHRVKIIAGLCVLFVTFVLGWTLFGRGSGPIEERSAVKVFLVDEDTLERVVRPITDVPPVANASGKLSLVRGVYYRCGEGEEKLAYLEKYTPEVQAQMKERLEQAAKNKGAVSMVQPEDGESLGEGYLIRSPVAGSAWMMQSDPRAKALYTLKCPGGAPPKISKP